MSDLFHADVPESFIRRAWNTMATAPQHTFQILTKRGEPARPYVVRMMEFKRSDLERTPMAIGESKTERIEVRTTPSVKALLQRVAGASHKNITDFLLDAGVNAAEDAGVNQRVFRVDAARWRAFQGVLDRPVSGKLRLARLLADKSVLE